MRRHFSPGSQFLGDDGRKAGELVGRVGAVPRQNIVVPLRMIVLLGMHGPNDGELVHVPGGQGQDLRDLDAVDVGGDGFEGAVGFRVPGVHLTGTTPSQRRMQASAFLPRSASAAEPAIRLSHSRIWLKLSPSAPTEPTRRKSRRPNSASVQFRQPTFFIRLHSLHDPDSPW